MKKFIKKLLVLSLVSAISTSAFLLTASANDDRHDYINDGRFVNDSRRDSSSGTGRLDQSLYTKYDFSAFSSHQQPVVNNNVTTTTKTTTTTTTKSVAATNFVNTVNAAVASKANIKLINQPFLSETEVLHLKNTVAAAGYSPTATFDNTYGGTVISRIVLDPSKLTSKTFATTVNSETPLAKNLETSFENHYNNNVIVLDFAQTYPTGTNATIYYRLYNIKTPSIHLYRYDSSTSKFVALTNQQYSVDTNGYISFTADPYGTIVISDGALAKK